MDRHNVDPTSLVFGLLFVIVGQMLLIGDPDIGTVWLGWTGPAVALGLGIVIVLAVRPRRSSAAAEDGGASGEDSDLHGRPAADDV
jgi:cytochrome c-type biogenesis protein CcmH/NrfF